ncbi:MAG: hypothetical protein P4L98_08800 [Ancalomicrobiaceae bacterium]|nr:hypothetical protein [Ancalomicrobiaceae bacterium]
MMGARMAMLEVLFCEFSLERQMPNDHLVRALNRAVDLTVLRGQIGRFSGLGIPHLLGADRRSRHERSYR